MGKKKIKTVVRLQIQAGKATRLPGGHCAGPHGINIMEFCRPTTSARQLRRMSSAEITVYEDRSFNFITKTPPAYDLLKKRPASRRLGAAQSRQGRTVTPPGPEIAEVKLADLNAFDIGRRCTPSRAPPAPWA